ncbi:MAG TPA: xanthine dehydrogenase family protein molybdopterin-binding subunit, partial [Ktedonobacteraceae bacterium]|nr:xanthine dehydrogenase family protein molybdopterin-binding subunit [Ktedonobacteraceae bacterium]
MSISIESRRRREDSPLLTGQGRFVDDLRPPEDRPAALHLVVVRSPYPHATIDHIDLEAARALPGVVLALSGAELVANLPPLETIALPGMKKPERRPMAVDRVRYIGDPVAIVLAEDRYIAVDAHSLVEIDYTPLPAISDPEAALAPGAPLLYEELETNQIYDLSSSWGDVEGVFARADHITHLRLVNQRLAPSSLEPRACLFDYDEASGILSAWLSCQAVYRAREVLSQSLGLPRERIHVYNADVGGGFGAKATFVGEELITASLAVKLGRPVKWIETRSENLQAQTHGRGQINDIEVAYLNDGTLLGLKIHTVGDIGAFLNGMGPLLPNRTPAMACGPYRIQAVESHVRGAFTNKIPTAPYRGAGRPEATYIAERAIDRIAHELQLDPAEIRRRNFIPPDAFPHQTVTGILYDSGNYPAGLAKALELAGYEEWREQQ